MPRVEIDKQHCKGCELCIVYCPKGCIKLDGAANTRGVHPALFSDDDSKCTGCSFCAVVCPDGCIEVYRDTNPHKFVTNPHE